MQQNMDQQFEPVGEGQQNGETKSAKKRGERGFAAMDPAQQKSIASKGGQAVSQNRDHMSQIGRKGGEAVSQNREHMSAIGRKGGEAGGKSTRNGG
ncbi:MAG: KGG domain-containing protein [Candidatus Obscuribacterales bacterium]